MRVCTVLYALGQPLPAGPAGAVVPGGAPAAQLLERGGPSRPAHGTTRAPLLNVLPTEIFGASFCFGRLVFFLVLVQACLWKLSCVCVMCVCQALNREEMMAIDRDSEEEDEEEDEDSEVCHTNTP